MDQLEHLRVHLKGKVIVAGIGNSMRCDDGVGALLAAKIKDRFPFLVWEVGETPENYLGKIVKENPQTVLFIDAGDFGGAPGEFRIVEAQEIKPANLFATHNASLELTINYLQNNIKADIIFLMIQPKLIAFGDTLSPEVKQTLKVLGEWFLNEGQKEGCRGIGIPNRNSEKNPYSG